jgi:hypothetical protein
MHSSFDTIIADRSVDVAGLGTELIVAGVIMAVLLLLMLLVKHDLRRRRQAAARRPAVSMDEFIDGVDAGPAYDALCVAVRQESASQTEIPVEAIYPSDTIEFLESFAGGRFDTACIIQAIEKGLGISISEEIANKMPFPHKGFRTEFTTIADCIRGFIECEEFAALLVGQEPSAGE